MPWLWALSCEFYIRPARVATSTSFAGPIWRSLQFLARSSPRLFPCSALNKDIFREKSPTGTDSFVNNTSSKFLVLLLPARVDSPDNQEEAFPFQHYFSGQGCCISLEDYFKRVGGAKVVGYIHFILLAAWSAE